MSDFQRNLSIIFAICIMEIMNWDCFRSLSNTVNRINVRSPTQEYQMLKNGCILQVKGIVIKISVKLSKLWSVRRGELKVLCQYSATTELQKIIMRREFCTISKLPLNFCSGHFELLTVFKNFQTTSDSGYVLKYPDDKAE